MRRLVLLPVLVGCGPMGALTVTLTASSSDDAAGEPPFGTTTSEEADSDADADADTDTDIDADTDTDIDADTDTDTDPVLTPANPFGIGLVGLGDTEQWDRALELAGPGGHVKIIALALEPGRTGPLPEEMAAVQALYDWDLVPVIRIGPPWGDRNVRQHGDGGDPRSYDALADSVANVVAGLPRHPELPLWIEVHNEPNLCYEWTCDPGAGWLDATTRAAEYAALLVDVAEALHGLGDPQVKVINGGLAPGGAVTCECGGEGWTGGHTSVDFLDLMLQAEPQLVDHLDGFASHPYPASGAGWGFFEAYGGSHVGLMWFDDELAALGDPALPVLVTETGWTTEAGAFGSHEDIADWTVQAWQNEWTDARIEAVMPFQLRDGNWDSFGWLDAGSGAPRPVFEAVRDHRCALAIPEPC